MKQILLLFFVISGLILYSQEDKSSNKNNKLLDKLYFGGNFGMQFGNETFIDFSPLVGIRLSEKLSVGTGLIYNYYSDKYNNYSTNIYGGRAFTRYYVLENVFLHTEFEALSLESKYFDYLQKYQNVNRFWSNNYLVGGGYFYKIGNRSGVSLMILFNLNESANSLYNNPIFRMGFVF